MADKTFPLTGFGSVAIHGGHQEDTLSSHLTPIFASSIFTFDTAEQGMRRFANEEPGYIYSRWGNPSFTDTENAICALESFGLKNSDGTPLALKAFLHASGQAAMTTLFLANLQQGDKLISHLALYGGTYELLTKILAPTGVETIIIDLRDLNITEDTLKKNPDIKWMHLETPANPTIQCVDIDALTKLAHKYGVGVSVDNTFATPYLQQPFKYDVDFVIHSTTKFLNGHGTSIGGVLIGRDLEKMNTKITKWFRLLGGNASPFDAYLLRMGIKTIELRMERHCANAMKVARYLQAHAAIEKVFYTGLESHPDFETSKRQMKHPGPMLSFEVGGGINNGKKFINALQMCTRAVSLGTTDTLISHPASMSHSSVPKEERLKSGISDGLIRMSVGIENIEDILADFEQALKNL
ncbi:MAG: aminotransferase class I/II-fold pyridoxal phosphate-dependent enzyme [Gemmatimonadaceae bacterium]|nr:aminotransferase class I/II-fold pyridoxal phosphate-dependent enzyme [Chitinophagaceae bacterium]